MLTSAIGRGKILLNYSEFFRKEYQDSNNLEII